MRKLIYVSKGKIFDRYKRKYDIFVTFVDKIGEDVMPGGKYYDHDEFADYVREARPFGVVCSFASQDEFEYVIALICDFVGSIYLMVNHNKMFDFTPIERCAKLDAVQMYWNKKQTTLWDVKKNTKLRSFEITDYFSISDMSVFRDSSVEMLCFFGCDGASSFVSKMHIDDFSFVLDMPKLKELHFDIIKDEPSDYYLKILAKCHGLETLYTTRNFFTFQQFAWLKAHLPNVKYGLECVFDGGDFQSIIGKNAPKRLQNIFRAKEFQKKYDELTVKYIIRENPPSDNEKDDI